MLAVPNRPNESEHTPVPTDTRRRSADGRITPHNLDAEASVLGAMLISTTAAKSVVATGLGANEFYSSAHQHIYHAIIGLLEVEVDYDVVIVANELRSSGLLEQCGGTDRLMELVNATPALSNVGRYSKIIRDTQRARDLITLAAHINETAYSEPDDISSAIADVEVRLLGLLDRVDTPDLPFTDMRAVLAGSLEPVQPTLLYRVDGKALIYPSRLNVLQGSPASGKTWIARMVSKTVIDDNGHVLILDFEDTAQALALGLLALGATETQIIEQIHFLKPDPTTTTNAKILKFVRSRSIDLLIIDSVAEALNFCGLSEDKPDEYLAWLAALPRQAAAGGTTVLMLDHIVKSKDEQGFWARGTGAKLGACDGATYNVKSTGFNQTTAGHIWMTVAKDRPGGLPARQGEKAAKIYMNPSDGGRVVDASIEVPPPEQTSTGKAEAIQEAAATEREQLAVRAIEVLAKADKPYSKRNLLAGMRAGKDGLKFSDGKVDSVLFDLIENRAIQELTVKGGHSAYALPPRQMKLSEGSNGDGNE